MVKQLFFFFLVVVVVVRGRGSYMHQRRIHVYRLYCGAYNPLQLEITQVLHHRNTKFCTNIQSSDVQVDDKWFSRYTCTD